MSDPKAFRVKGACGRVWEVPIEAVREDYAETMAQIDGTTIEQAREQFAKQGVVSVSFWLHEQFNWDDIERYGKLVQEASPEDVKAALDFMRSFSGIRDVTEVHDA